MPLHTTPSITRVARLALVVSDLHESERFFVEAFDFVARGRGEADAAFADLIGVPEAGARHVTLALGEQEVVLLQFDPPGSPYPPGSTSSDLWFQHFAIIVSDMAKAYAQLEAAGRFVPISQDGPVTLPGGIEAFKFRDLDGHPLELLAFPKDGGPEHWQARGGGELFLGIDHSAISVADTAVSTRFFEGCFGLKQSEQQENKGPEQSRMDDVPEARVTVTGLAPGVAPPHVEMLGYLVGERRPIAGETRSNDIAATHFVLETEDIEPIVEALTAASVRFVSPGIVTFGDGTRAIAVLDPDGHRFVIEEHRPNA